MQNKFAYAECLKLRYVFVRVLLQAVLASVDTTFQHALRMAGSTLDVDNYWPAHVHISSAC